MHNMKEIRPWHELHMNRVIQMKTQIKTNTELEYMARSHLKVDCSVCKAIIIPT